MHEHSLFAGAPRPVLMRMDELFASGVYDNEGIGIDIASTFELSMFEGKAVLCCGNATGKLFAIRKKRGGGGRVVIKGDTYCAGLKLFLLTEIRKPARLGYPFPYSPHFFRRAGCVAAGGGDCHPVVHADARWPGHLLSPGQLSDWICGLVL